VKTDALSLPYMNKGCCYENTSTEMFAEEENFGVNLHPLDFFCDDWESTSSDGREEDDDCACD
jgi:hypothetical protein